MITVLMEKKECCDKQAIFELRSENKKKILKSKGRAFQKIASTETLKWGENWSIWKISENLCG